MTRRVCSLREALLWGLLTCLVPPAFAGLEREEFNPARTLCHLSTARIVNPYQVATFMFVPRERVEFRLEGDHREPHLLDVNAGTLVEGTGLDWSWTAPTQPGFYKGELYHPDDGSITRLNLIVLVPMAANEAGSLNGYRIGSYPTPMRGFETFYRTPRGFIELTVENQETFVSPHFRLGQFPSKQKGRFPKYLVLSERLLIALETILEAVNQSGFPADTLFVMSGYRTPAYNKALGNVVNSRHVFGDAADIFVDQNPIDGMMDDLDSNGRIDLGDNRILAAIVEEALRGAGSALVGGMGLYPANAAHGPFVHVDLRGFSARW